MDKLTGIEEFKQKLIYILISPDKLIIKNGEHFFYKDNICYFQYYINVKFLTYSYVNVYLILYNICGFNKEEANIFIGEMILNTFKMNGVATTADMI